MATEHVKINDVTPFNETTANGTATEFEFDFVIFDPSDLKVYLDGALQLGGYTVTPTTSWPGTGKIVFGTAPAAATKVGRERDLAIERTTDFTDPGDFRASSINDQLDRIVAQQQDMELKRARSLRVPDGESTPADLPSAASRAGKLLGFHSGTGAPSLYTVDDLGDVTINYYWQGTINAEDYGVRRGTGNDYTSEVKQALAAASAAGGGVVQLPGYPILVTDLPLYDRVYIKGVPGFEPASNETDYGATKLIFGDVSGTLSAAMYNDDPLTNLSYAALRDVAIHVRSAATYSLMMDTVGPVAMNIRDVRAYTESLTVGGWRSRKLAGNISWVEHCWNLQVRLPDASTARSLDIDFGDSRLFGGSFTGGLGALAFPTGALNFFGVRFDRAQDGLTIGRQDLGDGSVTVVGGQIEGCSRYGLFVNGDYNDVVTGTRFAFGVGGDVMFRNPAATNHIKIVNASGSQLDSGRIGGVNFSNQTSGDAIDYDEAEWAELNIHPNQYHIGETRNDDALADTHLIDRFGIFLKEGHVRSRKAAAPFTPVAAFDTPGTSNFSYTTQTGRGNEIGNRYYFDVALSFTLTKGTGTGTFRITGLPQSPTLVAASVTLGRSDGMTYTVSPTAYVNTSGEILIWLGASGGAGAPAGAGVFANGSYTFFITGSFALS